MKVFTALAIFAGLIAGSSAAAIEKRAPPNIPTAASAKTMLAALPTRTTDATGYQRSLFPHWITISGNCNTRETVLNRDGTGLTIGSDCYPSSGSWFSPYDGATWTAASDLDIDHVVPLSNAWKSGANTWTTARRQTFANDLTNPQLIAVTDDVNSAKGDKSPDAWVPPLSSYHCTYARMWVKVKSVYSLSVTAAEKSKLTSMLNTC
ncbi:hypothetical protein BZA05DRAFT_581 [Tricharina praecox]|uniref:uncharacterized protein n=1 Tax=Tricharina praecox TaxID=43433 RepID=UPI002220D9C6|nr:uncharacterized protein BZA05DRAFT_581 [Tricharina praecox]KAI5858334.1 hypothetical protein BZA05DRAFT_581 [Tricharina praecox]